LEKADIRQRQIVENALSCNIYSSLFTITGSKKKKKKIFVCGLLIYCGMDSDSSRSLQATAARGVAAWSG